MREEAIYVSVWEEGIVDTKCTIVDGKHITDIEYNSACSHYETLLDEYVIYRHKKMAIDTETMTILSVLENKPVSLVDQVIEQIKRDIESGDTTAIEELLEGVQPEKLQGYLQEDQEAYDNGE